MLTQDRMPLEQKNLFFCLPPQELTDFDIFAPSNTRITFKLAKWDMSYHNQLYLCVIIPRYLYVINDPPCNSAYAAKRLNKQPLLLLLPTFFLHNYKWFATFIGKCMKRWLIQGSLGRQVTLLPGTTFQQINGALFPNKFGSQLVF